MGKLNSDADALRKVPRVDVRDDRLHIGGGGALVSTMAKTKVAVISNPKAKNTSIRSVGTRLYLQLSRFFLSFDDRTTSS